MKAFTRVGLVSIVVVLAISGKFATAEPLKLGITWPGDAQIGPIIENAFREKIEELIPDVDIELQNAPDVEAMGGVIAEFEQEKDGILVLGSIGAVWLRDHPPTIPTFIGGVNHPGALGVVKNIAAPEGNITGSTYYIPLEPQFEIFQAIIPNLNAVLLLLEKGQPATQFEREETQAVCEKFGLAYYESVCVTATECVVAVKDHNDAGTLVIIGNNELNIENTEKIVEAAGKTPVLSYATGTVSMGALGAFSADMLVMGQLLAESVVEVLVEGKAISEVPIKMDPRPKFILNITTAERLGLEIPYNILRAATIIE